MEEWLLGGNKITYYEKSDIKRRVWKELKLIWEIAFPSMLTRLSSLGILWIVQSFLQTLTNKFDFSASSLVQISLVRFIYSTLTDMSAETDQTSLSAKSSAGEAFQRSKKYDIFTAALAFPFFLFAIVLLAVQETTTGSFLKEIYLKSIPFLYYIIFHLTILMFLQPKCPKRKIVPLMCLSIVAFGIHTQLSHVFVHILDWGEVGSFLTANITIWISGMGHFLYFYEDFFPMNSSDNKSIDALELWPILKFSVSSGIVLCSDLFHNSYILLLVAEYMGNISSARFSAFSICLNICSIEFMICLGFLSSACVRISNELAKGNTKAAKFSIGVILSISFVVGAFFCILCLVFRRNISNLFSAEDQQVADAVLDLSTLLAFAILLKSINPVLSGVAIGAGLENTVAIINICCYYLIGIPLGALIAYVTHLQVKGLWIGILCGELAQLFALIFYLTQKVDW